MPNIQSLEDQKRVDSANVLYQFTAEAIVKLTDMGVCWSVENPTNSIMWLTSWFCKAKQILTGKHRLSDCQMCMHGGTRDKRTTLMYGGGALCLAKMSLLCDKKHKHASWLAGKEFATSGERRYPPLFCKRLAHRAKLAVLPHDAPMPITSASKQYIESQPRKGMQELVPEFKHIRSFSGCKAEDIQQAERRIKDKTAACTISSYCLKEGDKILGISVDGGVDGPKIDVGVAWSVKLLERVSVFGCRLTLLGSKNVGRCSSNLALQFEPKMVGILLAI